MYQSISTPYAQSKSYTFKRMFDFLIAGTFVCTLFPIIYLIIGTIIKLTSDGPIFFCQKRTGLMGKEFMCLKFRTMTVNDTADTQQARKHDPRITRFGSLLRRTSLDELPQFINVLLGDMSIVGPRPHMVSQNDHFTSIIPQYTDRLLVKPGITGLAQVSGHRGETPQISQMVQRVRLDVWYIQHMSFKLDLLIFLRTFLVFGDFKKHK